MCGAPLYDWVSNGGSVDVFLHMVSMGLVLWGVVVILGNGYGIYGQSYVAFFQGSKMSTGFYHRNLILGL